MAKRYASLRERLDANSVPVPFCGCAIWTGATRRAAAGEYGKINVRSRLRYRERSGAWRSDRDGQRKIKSLAAHRLSLALHLDVAYSKLNHVAHRCNVTLCINPLHLRSTTQRDNEADKRRASIF